MNVELDVPDELAQSLGLAQANISKRVLEALVVDGYRLGHLSRGRVSELLGIDFTSTEQLLKERGALLDYSGADVEEDLEHLGRMLGSA